MMPDLDENRLIEAAKRGDAMAKNELIRKYKQTIKIKVAGYSRAPIPTAALEGEAMRLLLHAVNRFDPKKGVQFKTFLEQNLRGLYRYTAKTKNVARIPEHQQLQISLFKRKERCMTI